MCFLWCLLLYTQISYAHSQCSLFWWLFGVLLLTMLNMKPKLGRTVEKSSTMRYFDSSAILQMINLYIWWLIFIPCLLDVNVYAKTNSPIDLLSPLLQIGSSHSILIVQVAQFDIILVSNTLDVECTSKLRSDSNVMLTYNSNNETNEDLVNLPPKKKVEVLW